MIREPLAKAIKAYRKSNDLTQAQMAEAIGVSLRFYQALEGQEQDAGLETIENIVKLGIKPNVIFGIDDKPSPKEALAVLESVVNKSVMDPLAAVDRNLEKAQSPILMPQFKELVDLFGTAPEGDRMAVWHILKRHRPKFIPREKKGPKSSEGE